MAQVKIKKTMKSLLSSETTDILKQIIRRIPNSQILSLFLGLIGLGILFYVRKRYYINIPVEVKPQDFSIGNIGYHLAVLMLTFIIIKSLFFSGINDQSINDKHLILQNKISIIAILFVSFLFQFLFLFYPTHISSLNREDGIIEWASSLALLLGFVIFLISFRNAYRKKSGLIHQCILVMLAVIYFLMAMEEISWGQRIFDWRTPLAFKNNFQNETNLHNFDQKGAYGLVMTGFYIGHYLLLVLLPFIGLTFNDMIKKSFLKYFVLNPYIIILGAMPSAFHGQFLNLSILYRMLLFSSFCILIILFYFKRKDVFKSYYLITAFLMVLIQSLYIIFNNRIVEYNMGVYEFNEFLCQYGLAVYAVGVLNNFKPGNSSH